MLLNHNDCLFYVEYSLTNRLGVQSPLNVVLIYILSTYWWKFAVLIAFTLWFYIHFSGNCDLYQGKWIYDPAGPLYTNNTCPSTVLTQMQNCQGNGRPDKDYENYRWKPDNCDLPRFNPRKFLELMRGKTVAFIGDSVARNQYESLLCILHQVSSLVLILLTVII